MEAAEDAPAVHREAHLRGGARRARASTRPGRSSRRRTAGTGAEDGAHGRHPGRRDSRWRRAGRWAARLHECRIIGAFVAQYTPRGGPWSAWSTGRPPRRVAKRSRRLR